MLDGCWTQMWITINRVFWGVFFARKTGFCLFLQMSSSFSSGCSGMMFDSFLESSSTPNTHQGTLLGTTLKYLMFLCLQCCIVAFGNSCLCSVSDWLSFVHQHHEAPGVMSSYQQATHEHVCFFQCVSKTLSNKVKRTSVLFADFILQTWEDCFFM